jgi:hypothetical protein
MTAESDITAKRTERIDVSGLDRRAVEALCLELRALAKRYGIEVADLQVVLGRGDAGAAGDGSA